MINYENRLLLAVTTVVILEGAAKTFSRRPQAVKKVKNGKAFPYCSDRSNYFIFF